jgi:hypothetical protein
MNEEIRKILDKEAKVAELDKKDNKKTIYSVCNFGKFEGFNKIEVVGKFNDKIKNFGDLIYFLKKEPESFENNLKIEIKAFSKKIKELNDTTLMFLKKITEGRKFELKVVLQDNPTRDEIFMLFKEDEILFDGRYLKTGFIHDDIDFKKEFNFYFIKKQFDLFRQVFKDLKPFADFLETRNNFQISFENDEVIFAFNMSNGFRKYIKITENGALEEVEGKILKIFYFERFVSKLRINELSESFKISFLLFHNIYVAKNGEYIRFADDYETNDIFIYNEGKLEIINENFTVNVSKTIELMKIIEKTVIKNNETKKNLLKNLEIIKNEFMKILENSKKENKNHSIERDEFLKKMFSE